MDAAQAVEEFLRGADQGFALEIRDSLTEELEEAGGPFAVAKADEESKALLAIVEGRRLAVYRLDGQAVTSIGWGELRGATLERRRELVHRQLEDAQWRFSHPYLPRLGELTLNVRLMRDDDEREQLWKALEQFTAPRVVS